MKNDDSGSFTIDMIAAYTFMIILIVSVFFTASNSISTALTRQYADELQPFAENIGDMLLKGRGSPENWHSDPISSGNVTLIGLSAGSPNILSERKVAALGHFNSSALARVIGLNDYDNRYGLRIEVLSNDGTIIMASGHVLKNGTKNAFISRRVAVIEQDDGTYKNAILTVYLWREYVGARASKN
jgi:hypothetical protein